MNDELLDVLTRLHRSGRPYAVAVVVETLGSSSAKPGSRAVIGETGRRLAGWIGGGCAEGAVCQAALQCLDSGVPQVLEIDMNDEVLGVGMPCGGSMRVFVEPVLPAPVLWLLGHGSICESLARLAVEQGYRVVANDPLLRPEDYPAGTRLITADNGYAELRPAPADAVVVATQHKGDHRSLARALDAGADYIGLISSRKRAALIGDYLREEGLAERALGRVRAPAGLDLAAHTPQEIALAVMAEIVMRRRGGAGGILPGALDAEP